MSSGFVPAGTILHTPSPPRSPKSTAWAAAHAAVTSTAPTTAPPPPPSLPDTRSLYEILQANKAAAQEAFEEKLKFSNQFRTLDNDDVEYLDSVVEGQRRVEAERRRAVEGEVERFREAQREGDVVEEVMGVGEMGGWGKRKRGRGKGRVGDVGVGAKVRREEEGEKLDGEDGEGKKKRKLEGRGDEKGRVVGKAGKVEGKQETSVPIPIPAPTAAGLGLDYGSDDDDG